MEDAPDIVNNLQENQEDQEEDEPERPERYPVPEGTRLFCWVRKLPETEEELLKKEQLEQQQDQGEVEEKEETEEEKKKKWEEYKASHTVVVLEKYMIEPSKKFTEMIQNADMKIEEGDEENYIQLEITENTFKIMDEYYKYYSDKPEYAKFIYKPIIENDICVLTCPWDAEFINRIIGQIEKGKDEYEHVEYLVDLLNGASEMDYPSIKDLSAGKLASLMTDREPEFMRKVLGVENDFTEEEYAKICEENKWAEEATKIDF